MQQIVTKTDGVPLFVEELTKTVLESGLLREHENHYELTGPLPALAIPATLQDSLMARLDRLATVKMVAQLGTTIGRQFAYDLLQAISPLDEDTLQQGLRQLVDAELLYQRGMPPQAAYIFKHALIQDVAYQSLLKSTRQHHHQRIAQVLAERFPETAEIHPELLAHHYTAAGLGDKALPYWQQAGALAFTRSAHVEAVGHLTQGLALLSSLPDPCQRPACELALQALLAPALVATQGPAAIAVEHAYARARALCQQMEETPQLIPILLGLYRFYTSRAAYQTAWEVAEQMRRMIQHTPDTPQCALAHYALGWNAFCRGEFTTALEHLETCRALYDAQPLHVLDVQAGHDPNVACRMYGTLPLWILGYPEQARQRGQEGMTLASHLSHPYSLAYALLVTTFLHQFLRETPAQLQEQAEAAMVLCTTQGFGPYLAGCTVLRGWALVAQGQGHEGIAQMREGLAAWQTTGLEQMRPYFLALLAEAYGHVGQADAGLTALMEALTLVDTTGERFYKAELHRLQGELRLKHVIPDEPQAETCFQHALTIAHHQQAKSLELRAAMSLARLWQRQGKRTEARELLAPIYSWFSEGFDTADLQEAKALLEALG
jgi:predicted ATPase